MMARVTAADTKKVKVDKPSEWAKQKPLRTVWLERTGRFDPKANEIECGHIDENGLLHLLLLIKKRLNNEQVYIRLKGQQKGLGFQKVYLVKFAKRELVMGNGVGSAWSVPIVNVADVQFSKKPAV